MNRYLFFLLHQDVVLLLQILTSAVFRFLVQMKAVLRADIKKHGTAGGVKSHFPVVQLAGLLAQIRLAVPIHVLLCPLLVDMVTVPDVEAAVIVFRVISAVLPGPSIVSCEFHLFLSFLKIMLCPCLSKPLKKRERVGR